MLDDGLCANIVLGRAERIDIGLFSQNDLSGWLIKAFLGETHYALKSNDDKIVLRADSNAAILGIYSEMEIDLSNTPFLNWSWKTSNLLIGNDDCIRLDNDYLTF